MQNVGNKLPQVIVRAGREKPLRNRHPWVFSGALAKIPDVDPGALVDVVKEDGSFLARGYCNPKSQLVVRVLTFDPNEPIDERFFLTRIESALARRASILDEQTDSCRLIMSEADGLPGLIVDKYGDWLVMQILTAGMERHRDLLAQALMKAMPVQGIFERSDDPVRDKEGLARVSGTRAGVEPPKEGILLRENGITFRVDVEAGHKTGYYLDQRENHGFARAAAKGVRALDAFSYTGGFTLHLLDGGAEHVLALDQSKQALTRLEENVTLNDFDPRRVERAEGDAFKVLRELQGESFDLISLDPPKFAKNRAQVEGAARGYKDLNLLAMRMVKPGGRLFTFSCSGHVSFDLFQKIVHGAAVDAGRTARVVRRLFQAADHPEILSFPESLYLKGLELVLD